MHSTLYARGRTAPRGRPPWPGALWMLYAGALAALACGRAESEPEHRPNLVLVVIDTLRADALGTLGSSRPTPRLDRIAEEGFVFTNAIAPSTWTLPSVASLMTSLHPSEHGLLGAGEGEEHMPEVLDDGLVTLAEAFHGAGYQTVGIVNQVYLRDKFGFAQGFDHYAGLRGHDAFRINKRLGKVLDGTGGEPGILAAAAGRPLFLYLHYLDPHWPYNSRLERAGAKLPPGLEAADLDQGLPKQPTEAAAWVAEQRDPDLRRQAVDTLQARYALEVQWTDAAMGGLVDLLTARGLWDDTILVITADHGEGFWEHEELLHGHAPYEEQIHVPLLIRLPSSMNLGSGRRSAPVGLIDLMPTLLDLAGIDVPEQCRGRSLVEALRGKEDAERALLVETLHERALRTRDAKLLLRHERDGAAVEYYDLAADPLERSNLASPCAGRCRESARRLRQLEQGLVSPPGADARQGGVTPEEIEELRTLGYVGD